jgi:ribosomal-protein-alanine N-acetyltransferase
VNETTDLARVRLRPLRLSDAPAVSALITPNVSRWVATCPSPFSLEAATERLTRALAANEAGTAFSRVAERKSDGAFMGWLGIAVMDEAARIGSMGYWLGEPFHGQGYLTEALPPFVAGAIAALRLKHLDAGAQVDNAASLAALKRLGMRFVEERMDQTPIRPDPELCAFYRLDCSAFRPSR